MGLGNERWSEGAGGRTVPRRFLMCRMCRAEGLGRPMDFGMAEETKEGNWASE